MTNSLEDEVQRIATNMDEQEKPQVETNTETETPDQEPLTTTPQQEEVYDVYTIPGKKGFVIVAADEAPPDFHTIEATFATQKSETLEPIDPLMYATGLFFVCLVLSCLALQLYLACNPFIATVTIMAKSQQISLN
jgi:hypothetical protein